MNAQPKPGLIVFATDAGLADGFENEIFGIKDHYDLQCHPNLFSFS